MPRPQNADGYREGFRESDKSSKVCIYPFASQYSISSTPCNYSLFSVSHPWPLTLITLTVSTNLLLIRNMLNYNIFSTSLCIVFLLNFASVSILVNSYDLPAVTFEILKPRGIRVSIPDEQGLQFFAFQGNVNKNILLHQPGEISGEAYQKKDGKWIVQDESKSLVDGDVIHYWINVQINGALHEKEETWTVTSQRQETQNVKWEHKDKKPEVHINELLFDDSFDTLNKSIWQHDVKIPFGPDYEFCVYHNEQHTFLVKSINGILQIKPVILEDQYGENVTAYGTLALSGCTSNIQDECFRKAISYNILPPVISARLTTKNSFSFKYGKIEIRAKFPEGDWLYPELWLEPKYHNYGMGYSSGRIILCLARGNDNLVNITTSSIFDSRRLDCGFRIGTMTSVEDRMVSKINENGPRWTKDFHVYTTIWNRDGFQFLVDNEEIGKLSPEESGWIYGNKFNKMAPFDQEFYITIGVGVGSIRVFPDGTTSSGYKKPWKNVGAKAMLQFWHARNQWLSSWRQQNGEKTAFEIDYIRVWSLL